MNLKEEYKKINFVDKMYKKIEYICQKEDKDISKLEWLEQYNNAIDSIIEKGWLNTYSAIHLLAEKTRDIELHFAGTNKGILENAPMFALWIMLDDKGEAKGGKYYGGTIPQEYIENKTYEEIEAEYIDKIFIKVKAKDKETIINELNEICTGWEEKIIIVETSANNDTNNYSRNFSKI